ncbi:MAG: type toxin-antitoxin system VapC family toxin [Rhizobium sp.]|nr:type toxin-antitoxin system VapC family toxin [Rhizobium sp.]
MMASCLDVGEIVLHVFVIGELAMGSMPRYDAVLAALQKLPKIGIARSDEVFAFVRENKLMGIGIGLVDAHLLASAKLTPDTQLWTRDKRLRRTAEMMGIASALP